MTRQRLLYWMLLLFLYASASSLVMTLFVQRGGVLIGKANWLVMVEGTAPRPFSYRTLVPTTTRLLLWAAALPPGGGGRDGTALTRAGDTAVQWATLNLARPSAVAPGHVLEFAACFGVMFVALFGFALVLRRLVRAVYPTPPAVADLASLVALVIIPAVFFRAENVIYDPMTLLMFTLGVYLIYIRSRLLYFLVFLLATVNKETSILLVPLFVLREQGVLRRWTLALLAAGQVLAFLGVKAAIAYALRGTPGSFVEFHLYDHNLGLVTQPAFYVKTFGVVIPLALMTVLDWKEKPSFLRRGLLVCLLPLVAFALFLGYVDELRDYYEAYPFVVLLALPSVRKLLEGERGDR
jgi:hypothetical protein